MHHGKLICIELERRLEKKKFLPNPKTVKGPFFNVHSVTLSPIPVYVRSLLSAAQLLTSTYILGPNAAFWNGRSMNVCTKRIWHLGHENSWLNATSLSFIFRSSESAALILLQIIFWEKYFDTFHFAFDNSWLPSGPIIWVRAYVGTHVWSLLFLSLSFSLGWKFEIPV